MGKTQISPQVFISHSQQDNELVRDIVRRLLAAGFDSYVDFHGSGKADDFAEQTKNHLRDAQVFIPLITPASLASMWSMRELGMAEALGHTVIPVIAGLSQKDLPAPLKSYKAIPFDRFDTAISRLSREFPMPLRQ